MTKTEWLLAWAKSQKDEHGASLWCYPDHLWTFGTTLFDLHAIPASEVATARYLAVYVAMHSGYVYALWKPSDTPAVPATRGKSHPLTALLDLEAQCALSLTRDGDVVYGAPPLLIL